MNEPDDPNKKKSPQEGDHAEAQPALHGAAPSSFPGAKTGNGRRLTEPLNDSTGFYIEASRMVGEWQTRLHKVEIYDTAHYGRIIRLDGLNITSEREEFVYEACVLMRDRISNREVWESMGLDADACIAASDRSALAQQFRYRLFSKIVPNVKSLGLLSPRQRERFECLGTDADLSVMNCAEAGAGGNQVT